MSNKQLIENYLEDKLTKEEVVGKSEDIKGLWLEVISLNSEKRYSKKSNDLYEFIRTYRKN